LIGSLGHAYRNFLMAGALRMMRRRRNSSTVALAFTIGLLAAANAFNVATVIVAFKGVPESRIDGYLLATVLWFFFYQVHRNLTRNLKLERELDVAAAEQRPISWGYGIYILGSMLLYYGVVISEL
jgi:hypothetical protein